MTVIHERKHPGEYVVSEANGTLSRENIVISAGAGLLLAGTILAQLTSANAGIATPTAGNTGDGTIAGLTVTSAATTGLYLVEITAAESGADAEFQVTGPGGENTGAGTVGQAFSAGGIAFTLSAGSTAFAVGDSFTLSVNAGLGEYVAYDNTGADDGRRTASAILYAEADATTQDVPAVAHVRLCEVNGAELTGLDLDAVEDLRPLGIIIR